jgi:hypothetical protein
MNPRYIAAVKKAEQIRMKLSFNSFQPLNIFDICQSLGVSVRFVDINMEGMYISQTTGKSPTILLSNQRPMPRRVYTCGHELGHHMFGHGSRIDALTGHAPGESLYNDEEFLADTFAGVLLMPVGGIQGEFNRRNWKMEAASQLDFYVISSLFGVGYQTLISHCKVNRLIGDAKATFLLKTTPAKLLQSINELSIDPAPFKILDGLSTLSTIDTEVSNYLFLPKDTAVDGDHLVKMEDSSRGTIFKAITPGIVRVSSTSLDFGSFIRIQNKRYVGLSQNRHLENDLD